jgi:large subunit ribosomal protein L9
MEVILLEDLGRVGNLGDKVNVKSGYGRNYLLPYGKALPATKENFAVFEKRRVELEQVAIEAKNAAETRGQAIAGKELIIQVKAGDEGKLFGSVTVRDIAEAITASGVEVDKTEVRLPDGALGRVGEYDVDVQLHSEVTVSVKVNIQPE